MPYLIKFAAWGILIMFTYYLKRILNNKVKLALILFIFFLPVTVILTSLKNISNGGSVSLPDLATFLTIPEGGICHSLICSYLPMYFLLIAGDDCIEDYKTGYKNLLITKWGKSRYFWFNNIKGFVVGFFVILLSLALNMIMVYITFAGGRYTGFGHYEEFMQYVMTTPFWDNCIYILLLSFISGVVSMGGVALSLALHNRFIVYPIVFILWYLPSAIGTSIQLMFYPFTEYPIGYSIITYFAVVGINIALLIFAYIKVIKYEQV